jgi:GT2 family glycosyltransferase
MHCGLSVARNLNVIVREMKGDWLWIMGDDHVFDENLLLQLLDHDVDVVMPVCFKRSPPFTLVLYERERVNDEGIIEYEPLRPNALPEKGLFPIHAAGNAGMLVRKHVLDAIGDPWFTTTQDNPNEDLEFCRRIRDAGFKIMVDPELWLGHLGRMQVWPARKDGKWAMQLHFDNDHKITLIDE